MIRAGIESGLDGLVITDHDRLVPPERLAYLNAKYAPFRVYGGVEVTTHRGHILVLGIDDDELTIQPGLTIRERLEQTWWTYSDLHALVMERGGFLAVAHPFRFNRARLGIDVDRFPPHALELYSQSTLRSALSRIEGIAARLDIPLLSNSDAHHASDLGAYYNVLDEKPEDVKALVALLKKGAFEPVAPPAS
jgi:predicted metal-dependent phosphoesterase TrpH